MTNKSIPLCIGVIMDGNRRFAKANGKMPTEGHRFGYKKLKEFLQWSKDSGVKTVIAYALSTENWKRSETELRCLMSIFKYALSNEIEGLKKDKVALRFIGDISRFPKNIARMMLDAEKETSKFKDFTLVLAVSYGGRAEILQAIKKVLVDNEITNSKSNDGGKTHKASLENLSEETFSKYLWTSGIAEPDMIIRTGGEIRMSNFLPWQSIYSELFFTKTLWPDFSKEEFVEMLSEFVKRKRNLGK